MQHLYVMVKVCYFMVLFWRPSCQNIIVFNIFFNSVCQVLLQKQKYPYIIKPKQNKNCVEVWKKCGGGKKGSTDSIFIYEAEISQQ